MNLEQLPQLPPKDADLRLPPKQKVSYEEAWNQVRKHLGDEAVFGSKSVHMRRFYESVSPTDPLLVREED